jgi:hypothetical protein
VKKQPDRSGQLRLILLAGDRSDDPVGVAAVPPHLPDPVWRLPGETPNQLYARALASAVGQGVVAARVMYRDDLPAPAATRH